MDNVGPMATLPEVALNSLLRPYQVEGRRRGAEPVKRDAVVHRDITQARPPASDAQLHHSTRLRWQKKKKEDMASRFDEPSFIQQVSVTWCDQHGLMTSCEKDDYSI